MTVMRDRGTRGLINPLLDLDQSVEFTELKPFRGRLQKLVENRILSGTGVSHISIYFRDLGNGPWFGVKEKEEFAPASLLKVPIAMAFLKQAEDDPELLKRELVLYDDLSPGGDQKLAPDQRVQPGKPYTVEELLRLMIVFSDNRAHDLLLDFMDRRRFRHVFEDLGLASVNLQAKEINISVKNYATFFRILYNASYLNRTMSARLLELLTQSAYKEGLAAGVPSGIRIAHKFGERLYDEHPEKQLHDCGIVYHPETPYLLCVMTRGRSSSESAAAIRDVSALVYREVDAQVGAR
jgi:beta-lactamase class A